MTLTEFRQSMRDRGPAETYAELTNPEWADNLDMIPPHMRDGIVRWVAMGQRSNPGHFLTALMAGDLFAVFQRGDAINLASLQDWVRFLFWYAPSGCWGSNAKYWAGLLEEEDGEIT